MQLDPAAHRREGLLDEPRGVDRGRLASCRSSSADLGPQRLDPRLRGALHPVLRQDRAHAGDGALAPGEEADVAQHRRADGEPLLLLAAGQLLLADREVAPASCRASGAACRAASPPPRRAGPRTPRARLARARDRLRDRVAEDRRPRACRRAAPAAPSRSPFAPADGEPARQVEVAQARRRRRRRGDASSTSKGSASSVSAGVAPAERPRAHADRLVPRPCSAPRT